MRPRSGTTADQIELRLAVAGARWHRLTRAVRESFDLARRRPLPYGVQTFGSIDVVLRPPRLLDATGWCETRIAERRWLQDAFGAPPASQASWAEEHTALAWTERCLHLRRAAARGRALPGVLVSAAGDGRVFGEVGIDMIDVSSRTGELSAWRSRQLHSARVVPWAVATLVLHAFTGPQMLLRVVAPVAVGNVAPEVALIALGFRRELILTALRPYGGVSMDHALYVLHNSSRARAALRDIVGA